jgi:monofunctional biosynthetic peptidoglycan transglycosylase
MKKIWKFLKRAIVGLFCFHLIYTLYIWILPPPITFTMIGSLLKGNGLERSYVSLPKAGRNAGLSVIAAEDQLFPTHNGFDWNGIQKALEFNENSTGKIRGGSTISQQVAKNVFLWQGRSYFRKGLEAYCTFWIELLYSKRRILELYLNIAETGKGIFGVEAAAQHYFKKHAYQLTASEAANIAAVLPSPVRYKAKPASPYIQKRSRWIQRQMKQLSGDPKVEAIVDHKK